MTRERNNRISFPGDPGDRLSGRIERLMPAARNGSISFPTPLETRNGRPKPPVTSCSCSVFSGATGDRTPDLMTASHALSQLSYSPTSTSGSAYSSAARPCQSSRTSVLGVSALGPDRQVAGGRPAGAPRVVSGGSCRPGAPMPRSSNASDGRAGRAPGVGAPRSGAVSKPEQDPEARPGHEQQNQAPGQRGLRQQLGAASGNTDIRRASPGSPRDLGRRGRGAALAVCWQWPGDGHMGEIRRRGAGAFQGFRVAISIGSGRDALVHIAAPGASPVAGAAAGATRREPHNFSAAHRFP